MLKNQVIKNNQLNGNLWIYFSGDPSFTKTDLFELIGQLKNLNIKNIQGNIILNTEAYTGSPVPLGVVHDDLAYCFMAPIQSIIINQNCLNISVNLNKNNQPFIIFSDPDDRAYFKINNHLNEVEGDQALKTCTFYPHMDSANNLTLSGCLPARKNLNFSFAIQNPNDYAKFLILKSLQAAHINFTGQVEIQNQRPQSPPISNQLKIIATHSSDDLENLLKTMLLTSNNIYAGSITRAIGKAYYGVGSNKAGVNAIIEITNNLLAKEGPLKNIRWEDGAGASRYNQISPESLVKILYAVHQNKFLFNNLKAALPRSGLSGTLKYRMSTKKLLGRVYAKTGSMSDVSALSGYFYGPGKQVYIFSILMNGLTQPLPIARDTQDQIVALLT